MTSEPAPRRASARPSQARPTLTVLVLTPLGAGGMGGIDRLMDEIRRRCAAAAPDIAVKFLTTRGPGSLAWAPLYTLAAALRLVCYRLTDGRCVCHANLASKGSTMRKLALTWLATRLGHSTVIHLHGALFHEYYRSVGPFQRRAIDRMYRESRCVIVLGNVWRDFIADTFGLTGSRVLVLPNASAARPPREPEAMPPEILFLGRLGARKGVPVLVAALGLLAKRDLAWRAEIAGDGDAAPYKTEIERLGLGARVNFPGWLAEPDAHRRLARAAVLVLPSEAEGLPMAVIEAFAWGVPVIATPVGSIPDILEDGVQGLMMPVGDAPALAQALERLLADPALRQRLGANALDCFRQRLDFAPFMERLVGCWRAAAPRK